ncbi:MAG: type II secretion system protein GspG [Proteobacteria bacterium]|nr:MAG: type II secretion system protein GspG [Pseudomonadota bacterium]
MLIRYRSYPKRKVYGFSLMELLVVLVIIGLIAGLVGPRLFGRVDESKQRAAEAQVKMLRGALETMYLNLGRFPTTDEGLSLLNTPPQDESIKAFWRGPYLSDDLPKDPWNNMYQYEYVGRDDIPFFLYSLGADGKKGGEGINRDIGKVGGNES